MRIVLLHQLIYNSTSELLSIFQKHIGFLPTTEALESTEVDVKLEADRPENIPELPLFPIDVLVDTEQVKLDPSFQITTDMFTQIVDLWEEYMRTMRSFVSDAVYKPFTKYSRY